MTLKIIDSAGAVVRKYSSNDERRKPDETQPFPTYWFNPPAPLSKHVGLNRFVWDLRYEQPKALRFGYSIAAAFGEDAIMQPEGPLVLPGTYRVMLSVGGKDYSSSFDVKMDPRVTAAPLALRQQFNLEAKIMEAMSDSFETVRQINDLRRQLNEVQSKLESDAGAKATLDAIAALDKKTAELVAVEQQWPPVGVVSAASLNGAFGSLLVQVDSADTAPTAQAADAFGMYKRLLDAQLAKWAELKGRDLPALNAQLQQRQLPPIRIKE